MENTAILKQLKIKTGTLNRNVKDYRSYANERDKQQERLEKLKAESDDSGKIRQNEEALAETIAMLPHSKSRIQTSSDELEALVGSAPSDISEAEEIMNANKALTDAKEFLSFI